MRALTRLKAPTLCLLLAACTATPPPGTPGGASTPTSPSSAAPASTPTATLSPTPTAELSAIVGTWHRKQTCEELRAAFKAEGLLQAHLDWFNELCAETRVPTEHSHFFTADGKFGSRDQDGKEVDSGDYTVVAPGELRFPTHARDLGYDGELVITFEIDGDVATFDVVVPSNCTDGCGRAYFWALSAFASGPWERGTAPSEATGRIVFARFSKELGWDEIVTINADGTQEQRLVAGAHDCPRWSADGTTIAMTGEMAPFFVLAGTGQRHKLDSPDGKLVLGCGTWSSTGIRYATESWDDADPGRNGIYVFDAEDGRNLHRLTWAPGGDSDVPGAFSPDDRWLAFSRGGDLMIVRTDGSEEPRLVASGDYGVPAFAADGRTLLADSGGRLYLIAIDERRGPLPVESRAPEFNGTAFGPRWSPDNQWIVFSMKSPGPYADLWRMRLDGTELTRITTHSDVDSILGDWVR